MPTSSFTFWTSCAGLTGSDVDELCRMKDAAVDVSYQTFRRAVGAEEVDLWAKDHGYDVGHERGGLRLSKDWSVGFYRSTWRGETCWFLIWSAYEMIWRSDG